MSRPLCIYHNNCADGFGAAWAIHHGYTYDPELKNCPMPEFIGGIYQQDPPDCTDRVVYFVDFCYKRPVMEKIIDQAASVMILDHHKSAFEDCGMLIVSGAVKGEFDMNRSGAMMAWNWAMPSIKPPKLIEHIQDRDLRKFDLPNTKAIQMAVFSYPYDFEVWDGLMIDERLPELVTEGRALERKHMKDILELRGVLERRMNIGGYDVPVMSVPYMMVSEAGHLMSEGELFAACYWDTADTRIFGLRSSDGGMDVSEVAIKYGGGGHRNVAGFSVPRSHELAQA